MNHWPFIIAAYAIAIGGTIAITAWSFAAMRRAEARAEALAGSRSRSAPAAPPLPEVVLGS